MKILGISGSLRAQSFNTSALRLAGSLMPPGMDLDVLDWRHVPPFDADLLATGFPSAVQDVREQFRASDGVLIVTPEYNFSIPGMLKNLIDWVSRGPDQPLARKPVAILSVSTGPLGGARVQYDLRKVMLFVEAFVLAKPEVFIGSAQQKFDAEGHCTDAATADFVRTQMQAFGRWVEDVAVLRARR